MRVIDIIDKKKIGAELTEEEIRFVLEGFDKGIVPDYQMSAWLMAVYFQGMTDEETYFLTKILIDSGDTFDFPGVDGVLVDKHSTGGVGDKITLALLPLMASLGIKMAKLSGRGLGYTGGTIDKYESIIDWEWAESEEDMIDCMNEIGFSCMQASKNILPLEKKLYVLRDATATINALPLMVSSILSKKLALRSDVILIDLKVGEGAFIKDVNRARLLAEKMKLTADRFGRKIVVMLTSMDDVLGYNIGNRNELVEAKETLAGRVHNNFSELLFKMAKEILHQVYPQKSETAIDQEIQKVINNGDAYDKFKAFIEYGKGDNRYLMRESVDEEFALHKKYVLAHQSGYIQKVQVEEIGLTSMKIGSGRATKEDRILYSASIRMRVKLGEYIEKGRPMMVLFSPVSIEDKVSLDSKKYFVIGDEPIEEKEIVLGVIK
ncbi:MAG: thymidine phosphorylase [Flavobacteriales bacterium]|jgi:pyrimidine-nucleoside phosphorylase|nr:thymidine phosphorylase [Flavobacteriales bacterium]